MAKEIHKQSGLFHLFSTLLYIVGCPDPPFVHEFFIDAEIVKGKKRRVKITIKEVLPNQEQPK